MRGQTPHSVHERFPNSRLILELHARETDPKHLSPQGRHLWSFSPFLVKWQPSKSHHKDLCSPEEHSRIQSPYNAGAPGSRNNPGLPGI